MIAGPELQYGGVDAVTRHAVRPIVEYVSKVNAAAL
jgi:hypothetical protein